MNTKKAAAKSFFVSVVVFIIGTTVFLLQNALNGKTKSYGNHPDNLQLETIRCVSDDYNYPFFTYDNTIRHDTEINVVFNNEAISSISLVYKLYYENINFAQTSNAFNHAAMNKEFSKEGLQADALNANYNVSDDVMRMSIYANKNTYNDQSKKYFLINGDPKDKTEYIDNYTQIGFTCKDIS